MPAATRITASGWRPHAQAVNRPATASAATRTIPAVGASHSRPNTRTQRSVNRPSTPTLSSAGADGPRGLRRCTMKARAISARQITAAPVTAVAGPSQPRLNAWTARNTSPITVMTAPRIETPTVILSLSAMYDATGPGAEAEAFGKGRCGTAAVGYGCRAGYWIGGCCTGCCPAGGPAGQASGRGCCCGGGEVPAGAPGCSAYVRCSGVSGLSRLSSLPRTSEAMRTVSRCAISDLRSDSRRSSPNLPRSAREPSGVEVPFIRFKLAVFAAGQEDLFPVRGTAMVVCTTACQ